MSDLVSAHENETRDIEPDQRVSSESPAQFAAAEARDEGDEKVELRDTRDDLGQDSSCAEPEERQQSSGSNTFNDALVLYPERLSEAVLAQPIKINVGVRRDAPKWHEAKGWTVFHLVDKLTQHAVGKKDGQAFLQGYTPSAERKKAAMTEMYIAGLDVDCGMPLQPVLDRIAALGMFAIVYTTHSHLTTESEINEKKFMEFARKHDLQDDPPDNAGLARFMKEVLHYVPEIADTAEYVHAITGTPNLLIKHAPIPKYRLIFPLAKTFVFAEQKREINGQMRRMTQPEAHNRWRAKMMGLAGLLNVPIDKSCAEPARLFYLPRHPENASEWKGYVIGGTPLDLDKVPEKDDRVRGAEEKDVFAKIADEMIGSAREMEFILASGTNLKEWAASFADGFQITMLFDDQQPDLVRERMTDHKWAVTCPFDDEHTNTGDADDRGTFICDGASDEANGGGFIFKCQHNHCSGRDRLHMMKKAIEEGWFEKAALTSEVYNDVLLKDGEERAENKLSFRQLSEWIASFSAGTDAERIQEFAELVARSGLASIQQKQLIAETAKKTRGRFTKANIAEEFTTASEKIARERRERENLAGDAKPIVSPHEDFDEARRQAWATLRARTVFNPYIFNYGGYLTRIIDDHATGSKISDQLTVAKMKNELNRHLRFLDRNAEGLTAAPSDLASDMLSEPRNQLPVLLGIKRAPFFIGSESGIIRIDQPGYDAQSRYYYDPAPGLVIPRVPEIPTAEDVRRAKHLLLNEVFGEFPLDDGNGSADSSKCHVLAMTLLPFMRELIAGPTPIHFVTKVTPRIGAGLLISSALRISTGQGGAAQSAPKDDDEMRKIITTACRADNSYLWIDNVTEVESKALAIGTTEDSWQDRILGGNNMFSGPLRLQFLLSGNNPTLSSEIAPRCLPIQLKINRDPRDREFRHPNLDEWIAKHRGELIWACLTLIQNWIATGKHEFAGKPLPRFQRWAAIIGGVLEACGMQGFLGNTDLAVSEANDEDANWAAAISVWLESDGNKFERWRLLSGGKDEDGRPQMSLIELFDDAAIDLGVVGKDDRGRNTSLGRRLNGKKDAPISIELRGKKIIVAIKRRKVAGGRMEYCLKKLDETQKEREPSPLDAVTALMRKGRPLQAEAIFDVDWLKAAI